MGSVWRCSPGGVASAGVACLLMAMVGVTVHGEEVGGQPAAVDLAARKAEALDAIEKATTGAQLRPRLTGAGGDVLRAGVARLGEIADGESVALLEELFAGLPRRVGTGGEETIRAAILHALARTGRPKAREAVENVVTTWLKEGPKVQGPYSHIYDAEYYAVVCAAISSLGTFPEEGIEARLQAVGDDEDLFYTLREAAWRSLLERDIRGRGLATAQERTAFLLGRIEPDGVFVENRWKGDRPGNKTSPALREAVVEDMIAAVGWEATGELQRYLASAPDDAHSVAAARMLAVAVLRRLPAPGTGAGTDEEKQALLAVADVLEGPPGDTAVSPTIAQIANYVGLGADALQDRDLWDRAKRLSARVRQPGAWVGPPPSEEDLGAKVPDGADFVPELSSRTATPYGTVLRAFYLTGGDAPAVVAHFEKETRQRAQAVAPPTGTDGQAGCFEIPFGQVPPELEGWVSLGITVYAGPPGGFEQRQFGESVRRGRAAFVIARLLHDG